MDVTVEVMMWGQNLGLAPRFGRGITLERERLQSDPIYAQSDPIDAQNDPVYAQSEPQK